MPTASHFLHVDTVCYVNLAVGGQGTCSGVRPFTWLHQASWPLGGDTGTPPHGMGALGPSSSLSLIQAVLGLLSALCFPSSSCHFPSRDREGLERNIRMCGSVVYVYRLELDVMCPLRHHSLLSQDQDRDQKGLAMLLSLYNPQHCSPDVQGHAKYVYVGILTNRATSLALTLFCVCYESVLYPCCIHMTMLVDVPMLLNR